MSHNAHVVARHATKKHNRAQFLKAKVNKASRTEQQQPVKPVQSCPNKNWIELVYKYTNNTPVGGANYRVYDLNNQSLACGTLDQMGFARVEGLPDGVTNVKFQFSSDPKPFEIYPGYKPRSHNMSEGTTEIKQADGKIVSVAKWLGTALAGDFAEDQTFGQIAFGTVVTLIPVVDQIGDVRDIIANYYQLTIGQRYNEFGPWFGLVTTLFGCVPEIGSVVKGMIKSVVTKVGSKLPLPQLMKFMNSVGMGNVIHFIREFLQKIHSHTGEFTKKILKMLDEMKNKLEKIKRAKMDKLESRFDDILRRASEGISTIYSLVPGKVREVIEVIAKHLRKTLNEVTDFALDGVTRTRNGARQLEEKFLRMTGQKVKDLAERAGMKQEHIDRLLLHCKQKDRVVIVRVSNPDSLRFQGALLEYEGKEVKCLPKPLSIKLNTAKEDFPEEIRGLVVRPKSPDTKQLEEIEALKRNGFTFDSNDVLHDPNGNVFHGDYDVQSVHRRVEEINPETGETKQILLNEMTNKKEGVATMDEFNEAVHQGVVPEELRQGQHGAEANFWKSKTSDKNDKYPILLADDLNGVGKKGGAMKLGEDYELGRQYGRNEKYIILTPEGEARILESPEDLKEFYRKSELPWEYDSRLATAAVANAANNAERAAEKAYDEHQMENKK